MKDRGNEYRGTDYGVTDAYVVLVKKERPSRSYSRSEMEIKSGWMGPRMTYKYTHGQALIFNATNRDASKLVKLNIGDSTETSLQIRESVAIGLRNTPFENCLHPLISLIQK